MSNKRNLLFYKSDCKLSQVVIQLLNSEGLLNSIDCLDVDKLKKIPSQIKQVPTLILPQLNKILIGKEILLFIQNIKQSKNQFKQEQINQIDKEDLYLNQQNHLNNEQPKEQFKEPPKEQPKEKKILGYIQNEMDGFSDKYAYKDINEAPQHNFVNCKNIEQTIYTGQEENIKYDDTKLNVLKSKLETERKLQEREIEKTFKEQSKLRDQIIAKQNEINKKIEEQVNERNKKLFNQ